MVCNLYILYYINISIHMKSIEGGIMSCFISIIIYIQYCNSINYKYIVINQYSSIIRLCLFSYFHQNRTFLLYQYYCYIGLYDLSYAYLNYTYFSFDFLIKHHQLQDKNYLTWNQSSINDYFITTAVFKLIYKFFSTLLFFCFFFLI